MVRPAPRRSSALTLARKLPGSIASQAPGFVPPQLATLRDAAPAGDRWLFEIKHDGYRAQLHLRDGEATIYTRGGHDWTRRFASVAADGVRMAAHEAVLDGEIVVAGQNGVSNFSAMQADLAAGRVDRFRFYAFDLLHLDGLDLRSAALEARKRVLAALIDGSDLKRIVYSEHLEEDGARMFGQACLMKLEGIIAKLRDGPYRSGRSENWLKIKCARRESFPIIGFVPGVGGFAALRLGRREGDQLLYVGKAGIGFTAKIARELRQRLDRMKLAQSPLTAPVRKKDTTWMRPELMAEIEYRDVTDDGRVRHASFKGLAPGSVPDDPPSENPRPRSLRSAVPRPRKS
jgi:bifunctional non-homologous end joining protein LigD